MKKNLFASLFLGFMLLLGACSESDPATPPTPPEPTPPTPENEYRNLSEGPFEISVLELHASTLKLFIAPENTSSYYWYGVITEEYLSTFGSLEDIPVAVAAYTASRLAEYPDTPPTDLLKRGDYVGDIIGLQPEMHIVIFAAEADQTGRITSEVEAIGLTMPKVQPSENILTVEISNVTATNADLKITPTNDDPYVWMELPEYVYADMSDEELKAFLLQYYTPFFPLHTSRGELNHNFSDNLDPNTGYKVLAFGYDGGMTTELFSVEFRTKIPGDPTLTTFDFTIDRLGSRSVDVTINPSDQSVKYLAILAEEALLEEYGGVNENAVKALIDEQIEMSIRFGECEDRREFAESYAHRGSTEINFYLTPGMSHQLCAVALDNAGNFASAVAMKQVVAPEVELSKALVEAEFGPYFDGDALAALDAERYYDYAGAAVLPIAFTLNEVGSYAVYTLLTPESLVGISDDQLTSLLLNGEYLDELTFLTEDRVDVLLDWNAEYLLCMIAMDENDYAGALVKQTVPALTKSGASPVGEYTPLVQHSAKGHSLKQRLLFGKR